ncbi:hypothetical protein [Lentzea terrae]|uniref:hypothetical protein n=1 Tax=Lentzea terrae TaxID=2200761 RepID=UPI001300B17F|nr:hypothetical protein [Lentzea terrae]
MGARHRVRAALCSRNLWAALAGAGGAVALWFAIPFSVFGRWDAMWSGLHF